MRTTLTLEDDLADRLAQIARATRQSFKAVVNETLRLGLAEHRPSVPPFDYDLMREISSLASMTGASMNSPSS